MEKAKPFDRGIVTISLDTEIGWARINSGEYGDIADRLDHGKDAILRLLDLFDEHAIPVTWAVVGQLCRSNPPNPPDTAGVEVTPDGSDIPWERDWWHAPDLVERIRSADVDHELGSHAGNHLVYGDATREQAQRDLAAFREWGPNAESFVFPQNSIGHLEELSADGFTCFRGRPPRLGSEPTPTAFRPRRHHGLVDIPMSLSFRHYEGRNAVLRRLPLAVKVAALGAGIKHAAYRNSVFHVVLHPNDFALEDGKRLLDGLQSWLSTVEELRASGTIDVLTMADVADRTTF